MQHCTLHSEVFVIEDKLSCIQVRYIYTKKCLFVWLFWFRVHFFLKIIEKCYFLPHQAKFMVKIIKAEILQKQYIMLIIDGPLSLIIGHLYSSKYYILIQPDQSSPLLLRNLLPHILGFLPVPGPNPSDGSSWPHHGNWLIWEYT